MSKKIISRSLAVLLAFGLVASACGGREDSSPADGSFTTLPPDTSPDDTTPDAPTDTTPDAPADTTPPEADPCDVELEATEIGVTADTIKVIVMADSDNILAPGLFDGARVGAQAWAADLNDRGGIACRQIEIEFADSQLSPEQTVNGFLLACDEALALVGTTVLLGRNTTDLNTCPDQAGNPIGVPDLAYITTEVAHQCSTTSFHMSRPGASCPYEGGTRDYAASTGPFQWLADNAEVPLNGISLIPADFQTTRDSTVPQIIAQESVGITYDGYFGISAIAPLGAYTPFVQRMRDNDANWIFNGSNDATLINMLEETGNQGYDLSSTTIFCTLACYTPSFLDQGALVEGVYVSTMFVPFGEADTNEDLAAFLSAVDDPFPASWAAGAWADGKLFEVAINQIVERDGPNAITRQALLDEIPTITDFDANGWWGNVDFSTTLNTTSCFVLLQVQDGAFARVHPAEPGTLECGLGEVLAINTDPAEFPYDT